MNLIEHLGGYKKAKGLYDDHHNNPLNHHILGAELLEYRRQHNIFEVGDKVVAPILSGVFVGKIINYRSDIDRFDVMGSRHWGWFFAHQLNHAADAEIAAGHSIDKPELEELSMYDIGPNVVVIEK